MSTDHSYIKMSNTPLENPITLDASFLERTQHAWNKIEWHVPKTTRGRFLDIGCGKGNGVIAALMHGFSMAVGVDMDLRLFNPASESFSAACSHYGVNERAALLIEQNIFESHFPITKFDCVMMIDSIEHVPNPEQFVRFAAENLTPGGIFLIDTCPLYYSQAGAHLWGYFDTDTMPWVHLRHDFKQLMDKNNIDEWSRRAFNELNRATHDQIRKAFQDVGLAIVSEHRATSTAKAMRQLEDNHHLLNLDGIDQKLLFEDWILIVGQKHSAG